MWAKGDIDRYGNDYLDALDRADLAYGSYIYIARKGVPRKDSNVIDIEQTKDGWRVEYVREPDDSTIKQLGLRFIRRGKL